MTAVQRLVSNGNSIINFLKNFSSSTPQDVSVDWVNDDGSVETKTFANIKKFQDSVDIKNNNNELVSSTGENLSIHNANNIEGKSLLDIQGMVTNPHNFKFLVDTERSFPERWMVGVNQKNQIVGWGYQNTYIYNSGNSDSLGSFVYEVPFEVQGLEPKEIIATTWGIYLLYPNGDLYTRGHNGYGQLGRGNTSHNTTGFEKVLTDVIKVSTSSHGYHQDYISVLALREVDGVREVWGAGRNGYGQLGRGNNTENRTTFEKAQFTSDLTGEDSIIDIFVTDTNIISTYALTDTGKLFSCGWNGDGGCLGLGDTTNRSTFTLSTGNLANEEVIEVVTGGGTRSGNNAYYRHSVIVRCASGRLFSWGYGGNSELGLGNTISYNTPQEITWFADNGLTVTSLYGFRGSWTNYFAICSNGKAYAWGYNSYGSLGIGNTSITGTPTEVILPYADGLTVKKIYRGAGSGTYSYHHGTLFVCDINGRDVIYSAGHDGENQVGDYSGQANTPRQIRFGVNPNAKVKQVSTGGSSSSWFYVCLFDNGEAYAWGDNDYQTCRLYDSNSNIVAPALIGA